MQDSQDTDASLETQAPGIAAPTEPPDESGGSTDTLAAAGPKLVEMQDAWLRAKAETENVRRRAQEDVAKAHKFAVESFSTELLAVRDSLEAALAVQNATIETMRSGVEITLRQLAGVFDKFAVRPIDPVGEKFDPHRHQAMSIVDADAPPNTVVTVFQKGYLLHDRVLRPALVTVAKPKDG